MRRSLERSWWVAAWTALVGCAEPSSFVPMPSAPSDAASALLAVEAPSFAVYAAELGGPLWVPFEQGTQAQVYLMFQRSSLAELRVAAGALSPALAPSTPAPAPAATFLSAVDSGSFSPWISADYATAVSPRVRSFPLPSAARSGCESFGARQVAVSLGASLFDAITAVEGAFVISAHEASSGNLILLRAQGGEIELVEASTVGPTLTSLAYDGSSVWGGSVDGRLLEISPAGRRLGPELTVSSTAVYVAANPAREIIAYDHQQLWRVRGGAVPRVEPFPPPPHPIVSATLGLGGRALAQAVVPSALGRRLRVSSFDGQSWTEQTPSDATDYSGPSAFTAVVAGDRGFALLGWLQVWQRDYEGAGWRALDPPALGPGFAGGEIRYLAPMKDGGLAVTGANGVVDILRHLSGGAEEWCQVRSGSVRAYDGIAVLPDQSALMLIYNAAQAAHVLLISVPP